MKGVTVLLALLAAVHCSSPPSGRQGETTPDFGSERAPTDPDSTDAAREVAVTSVVAVTIEPATLRLETQTTGMLAATAFDAEGGVVLGSTFSWASSDAAIVEVTPDGVVIGREIGTATVTATTEGVTGTADVIVTGPPIDRVVVAPTSRIMAVGEAITMSVTLFDARNAPIEDPRDVAFSTSDESIVSVDAGGLVTAVSGGAATVTTTVEGIEATSAFTVTAEPIDRVDVVPQSLRLIRGDTAQLVGAAFSGDTEETSVPLQWSSSDPTVATVDATGLVTSLDEGTTYVTATAAGVSGSVEVTVTFDFSQITAGGMHACGLVEGRAYCWGADGDLQLGHDAGAGPARVVTDLTFQRIAAGGRHTCAIDVDGKAHCWGRGDEGQRGDGSILGAALPAPVAGNHTFVAIAASSSGTCAVESGQLCCWGEYGESNSLTPVIMGPYTSPSMGAGHVCAVQGNAGYCFGDNADGQLGLNAFGGSFAPWQPVTGGFTFDRFGAGARHTCAMTTGGATACWGDNTFGQVGDGTNDPRSTPILISSPVALSRVSAGSEHTCALSLAGVPYCWGRNDVGQLGTGAAAGTVTTPTVATTVETFSAISAGGKFTCAISVDGDPHCWGDGTDGQLGRGGSSLVPRVVPGF